MEYDLLPSCLSFVGAPFRLPSLQAGVDSMTASWPHALCDARLAGRPGQTDAIDDAALI